METREIRLARRPHGEPVDADFELAARELGEPAEGQLLVRNRFMSVDPYMRGRMNDAKSYVPPFELGKALQGGAVGEVVGTGELVVHDRGWREHALVSADKARAAPLPHGVSPSALLGALGMPGMTAWVGVTEIAPVHEGDTVFISAAAGAVGSVAGQIAKARGCRVIGSAGGPAKAEYVRDVLGFDACFDYRAIKARDALREVAPDGIDVYFDNVGGEQLEGSIAALNRFGRVAMCGAISQYNETAPVGTRNMSLVITKRLTLRGFIVLDHSDRRPAFVEEVGGWLREGKVRFQETFVDGVEHAPDAFLGLLRGDNVGKMLVRIS